MNTNSEFGVTALGTVTEKISTKDRSVTGDDLMIGLTINLSPTHKLTARQRKATGYERWYQLDPSQQIEVLKGMLNDKVYPLIDMAETHFEFTQKGEIHSHSALVMKKEKKHQVWNLQMFRKRLNQEFKVAGKPSIRMLHSFVVDDMLKWLEYIRKCDDEMPIKPDYQNINCFLQIK